MNMRLQPSDIPVALQLALLPEAKYEELANALGIGLSSAHRSVKRLQGAGLLLPQYRKLNRLAFREFLRHGIRYAFSVAPGSASLGVPTAYSAPPLSHEILADDAVVWPSADGVTEGSSIVPLYPKAPYLVNNNQPLYEALALVDALRIGRAREQKLAREYLDARLLDQAA